VHHHYLKGSLFCGRCRKNGTVRRMIIQHTVNSRGYEYTYFFCRNKQNGSCNAPHINILHVEEAVETHYATVRFNPGFIADVRAHVVATLHRTSELQRACCDSSSPRSSATLAPRRRS
jgi:hypothetical protein